MNDLKINVDKTQAKYIDTLVIVTTFHMGCPGIKKMNYIIYFFNDFARCINNIWDIGNSC